MKFGEEVLPVSLGVVMVALAVFLLTPGIVELWFVVTGGMPLGSRVGVEDPASFDLLSPVNRCRI